MSARYATILWRAWRLRCPRCGRRKLFRNWIQMHPECGFCHLRYEREPGFFLGSAYINYGLTALAATVLFMALFAGGYRRSAVWIVGAFVVVFPIWFFRYARSLWLGFDHFWDPPQEQQKAGRAIGGNGDLTPGEP